VFADRDGATLVEHIDALQLAFAVTRPNGRFGAMRWSRCVGRGNSIQTGLPPEWRCEVSDPKSVKRIASLTCVMD